MSQWTHVNAVIRYDGIKGITPDPNLGTTISFDGEDDEDESLWDKCDVPLGSGGSLQYVLTEVGDGAARFVAAIYGDLSDYDDVDEIIAYFKRITEGHIIRSGIVEIDVEYGETIVMQHQHREEEVIGEWVIVHKTIPT